MNTEERQMNNEIKSSEALKAYAREVLCENNTTNSLLIRMFDEIIDNAPTVEGELLTKEAYSNLCLRASRESPQGEWIIKPKENSQSAILICNKCNHFIPVTIDKNFCPNCGAEMNNKISSDSGIREFDKKFADLIVFNDQPQRPLKSSDVHEDV